MAWTDGHCWTDYRRPVLDTDMLEKDRLAWQQLATGMRRTPDGDHPVLGGNDDVTGDD